MRKFILMTISVLFSAAVFAGNGSGQTGPHIECQLKDGSVSYLPAMICKANDGKEL